MRNKAKIGCGRTEKTGENSSNAACPFTTLKNYLKLRKSYRDKEEQFFVFRDRSPVTQWHFRKMLRDLLKLNNVDQAFYSTHALRSGRSCDLLDMGVSVETIRKLGCWKSTSVYTYLRT